MGKRKREGFIDRAKSLADAGKRPNVLPEVKAIVCEKALKSSERHFKYKIVVDGDPNILQGMIMENEICVLCMDSSAYVRRYGDNIASVKFVESLQTNRVSGKRKKGAQVVQAGATLVEIYHADGTLQTITTPIGGQLLELNTQLLKDASKLLANSFGDGYVAVIFANTEIPTPDTDWSALFAQMQKPTTNVCFQWIRGSCNRGESCKFAHQTGTDTKD